MLSIPIISQYSDGDARPLFLSELKRAEADRVFLITNTRFATTEERQREMGVLSDNIRYYTENGLDVGVWIQGFGHGGVPIPEGTASESPYTLIVGLADGASSAESFCPADPTYFALFRDEVCDVARAGARLIMIDDDLRLALHSPVGLGCACPRHLALFNERARTAALTDHELTREELASVLFTGQTNPLRRIWLDLMGDTLRTFARDLRIALDEVDPTIRLGHCACLPTWDVDGVDSLELARLFAGSTRPFLRLIGAPYWNRHPAFFGAANLGSVVELERMQLGWIRDSGTDIEVFTEGDVYPRPRYIVPESFVEGFDQALLADGSSDGILKYMNGYSPDPFYEPGYIDRHCYFAPLRRRIAEAFDSTEDAGIYVFEAMHKLADADCTGLSESTIIRRFLPESLNFVTRTSLPSSFRRTRHTKVALVFGENARYLDDETAKLPLILDRTAARILTDRGMDVGLEQLSEDDHHGRLYVNGEGIGYFLYPYDAATDQDHCQEGHPRYWDRYDLRAKLYDAVRRMAEGALPAALVKEPGTFLLCKKTETAMAVGIWNFGSDYLMPRSIELDGTYTSVTPIGDTKVTLSDRVASVDGIVPPFCFAGFTVKEAE